MEQRRRLWWLTAFAAASALTLLCVLLLDRPAATFAHDAFRNDPRFIALTHIVDPIPPLATLGFLGIGAAVLLGWSPPGWVRALFVICAATLLGIVVKDELKYLFGRTWPETWVNNNPSWIRDGVVVFAPFHGGPGWASFPSGHTTVATAPMAAIMLLLRTAWRWLCAIPIVLVVVGLYGADYHFVGDMVAGAMLGTVCAAIAVACVFPRPST